MSRVTKKPTDDSRRRLGRWFWDQVAMNLGTNSYFLLKENLRKTNRLIEQIVYKLYDLTEEEIKIVEGRG